ncbi:MAG: hypothetical protein Q4D88_06545, partial [Anaerococcus sp.]|nr:hypothetical protein [Anaerococcus sp.]
MKKSKVLAIALSAGLVFAGGLNNALAQDLPADFDVIPSDHSDVDDYHEYQPDGPGLDEVFDTDLPADFEVVPEDPETP